MSTSDRSLRTRLADELRAEMARKGMSHRRMAELIGHPHNTVSRWLNGLSAIDADVLERMCNELGMDIPDLYAAAKRNGGWTLQMPSVRPRPRRLVAALDSPNTSQGTRPDTREYRQPAMAA